MIKLNKNKRRNDRKSDSAGTHNDWVEVDSVHVQPLDLLQVSVLGLGGDQTDQAGVCLLYPLLQLLRLVCEEPELGHVARAVPGHVIVAQLRCKCQDI